MEKYGNREKKTLGSIPISIFFSHHLVAPGSRMNSLHVLGIVPTGTVGADSTHVFKEWSRVGRDRPLVYMTGVRF